MQKRLGLTALISQTLCVSLELGLSFCSLSPGSSRFDNSIWTQISAVWRRRGNTLSGIGICLTAEATKVSCPVKAQSAA